MNRSVKILLITLAGLVIAGAGFWAGIFSGTRITPMARMSAVMNNQSIDGGVDQSDVSPWGRMRPELRQPLSTDQTDTNNSRRFSNNDSRSEYRRIPFNNSDSGIMRSQMSQGMSMPRAYDNFGGRYPMSIGSMFMRGGMMLFGLLFFLAFAILMVLGIIVLFRMVRGQKTVAVESTAVCGKCGSPIQDGWKHCPQCGNKI
ncbi:MAG: zinc ribbon domain-containing protein [Leptolinea sp.]|nr:zinc ribbon domain-containing protein [Leptolinea sp.]